MLALDAKMTFDDNALYRQKDVGRSGMYTKRTPPSSRRRNGISHV